MPKAPQFLRAIALFGVLVLATSCNRGVGCPNNFKIGSAIEGLIQQLSSLFF